MSKSPLALAEEFFPFRFTHFDFNDLYFPWFNVLSPIERSHRAYVGGSSVFPRSSLDRLRAINGLALGKIVTFHESLHPLVSSWRSRRLCARVLLPLDFSARIVVEVTAVGGELLHACRPVRGLRTFFEAQTKTAHSVVRRLRFLAPRSTFSGYRESRATARCPRAWRAAVPVAQPCAGDSSA